jgi:hypothetical protein
MTRARTKPKARFALNDGLNLHSRARTRKRRMVRRKRDRALNQENTMMPSNSKIMRDMNAKTIQGIDEYFSKIKHITLDGTVYTVAELKALFQRNTNALNAAEAGHVKLKQLVKAQRESNAATMRVRRALRNYLLAQYGPEALHVLADFGFVRQRATPTVETKSLAVIKMLATRDARHTLGKRQRAKIKGELAAASSDVLAADNGTRLNGPTGSRT